MVSDTRLELKSDRDAQKSKQAVDEIAANSAPSGAADAPAIDRAGNDSASKDEVAKAAARGVSAPAPEAAAAKSATQPALVGTNEVQLNAVIPKTAAAPATAEPDNTQVGERTPSGAKETTAPGETMYVVCRLTAQQCSAWGHAGGGRGADYAGAAIADGGR